MPKILMLTCYDAAHEPLAQVSVPAMRQYAERHDCEFRALTSTIFDRPPNWIKIRAIREALTEDFDFVWWLDVDACIVRSDIDIRTAIQARADLHLAWIGPDTIDWFPPGAASVHAPSYNNGVMLIRTSSWSEEIFANIWEAGEIAGGLWHDQSTMIHLLGCGDVSKPSSLRPTRDSHVAHLDVAWNNIPGIATTRHPIIRHYAGMENTMRLPLMKIDCEALAASRDAASDELRRVLWNQLDALIWEARPRTKLTEFEQLAASHAAAIANTAAIANLSAELALSHEEAVRYQRELDAVHRSRSWRLTAPLRSARLYLQRRIEQRPRRRRSEFREASGSREP